VDGVDSEQNASYEATQSDGEGEEISDVSSEIFLTYKVLCSTL